MTDAAMSTGPASDGPEGNRRSVVYKRDKKTKASVIWADRIATRGIMVGGFAVILAVFMIAVFLVMVALPLFSSGRVTDTKSYSLGTAGADIVSTSMDEYRALAVELLKDGKLSAFYMANGTRLANPPSADLGGKTASAFARTLRGDDIALAFPDGTVRLGRISIDPVVTPASATPADAKEIAPGVKATATTLYMQVPGGQTRALQPKIELQAPIQVAPAGTAIRFIDYRVGGTSESPVETFVTVDDHGTARLSTAYSQVNMMTGETTTSTVNTEIPTGVATANVTGLLLNTPADRVIVALDDGSIRRFDTRNPAKPRLAETARLAPPGVKLTALGYLNGENSLISAGADGSLAVWTLVDRKSTATADGLVMTRIHEIPHTGAPITALSPSQRTRLFLAADAAGGVGLYHATTERLILELAKSGGASPVQTALLAPRDDGAIVIGRDGGVRLWSFAVSHPETTLKSLFGKVWYEGYSEPGYTWQSTAATDSFEPKFSLTPLIFGTIKGAFYSLIFAVPIALLAAIYTSEFLHFRIRGIVKPLMELLASLPSVVIGFVVALVLSPIVENWIAAIVIAFGVIPLTLIGSAFLWQLLPQPLALRLDGMPKLIAFFIAMAAGIWFTILGGPVFERLFFGGDFKAWTTGEGSATPFLFLLVLPISFLAVFAIGGRILGRSYRDSLRTKEYHVAGFWELGRWLLFTVLALGLAVVLAKLFASSGFDARGGIVDTYVQRNTLIASFGMAFAVIPIIYSIAEDALGAVPEHLRSASLGCGATKWQTARWVILPTAGSGIFSAIMIGLGRAVGETMIVVMATGNTPVTNWSLFSGLRALSANINVELPEAVKDSTLYRTLFLCGLVLFVMTFILNTFAEIVRQRFRKRAAQL